MLDFEMAVPIVYPQGTVLFAAPSSGAGQAGVFNPFLDAIDGSYCNFTSHGITGDTPASRSLHTPTGAPCCPRPERDVFLRCLTV